MSADPATLPATPLSPGPGGVQTNPSTVAREALRQLSAERLPPTPDNYTRAYHEIATPGVRAAPAAALAMLRELAAELQRIPGRPIPEAATLRRAVDKTDWLQVKTLLLHLCVTPETPGSLPTWAPLIRDLVHLWGTRTPGLTQARKRENLEHVLAAFATAPDALYARLRGLVRAWGDAGANGVAAPAIAVRDDPAVASGVEADTAIVDAMGAAPVDTPPAADFPLAPADGDVVPDVEVDEAAATGWSEAALVCREMLAQAIKAGVTARLGYPEELAREAELLAAEVRTAMEMRAVSALAAKLERFWVAVEAASGTQHEIQQGLLRLLQLLTANVSELVGDGSWMRGQLKAFRALADGPVTLETIANLERGLREIAQRQGVLKQNLEQAKDAMKQMVATFIERVGTLAADTGQYHDRLAVYATKIEQAEDISQLSSLIVDVMEDTREVQTDLGRSRDELLAARRTVEEFQDRTNRLESELIVLSDRLQEDQLTQVLNRRGLERMYENEAARADRYRRPMSLAMLDVDNFKALNDRLGHQAGDSALVHLTASVRQSLRATDIIARYGGEEFVILLPETTRDDAFAVLTRVQRELTRRFFLHNHERVLITFSAGVAERFAGEAQEDVIARADRALYEAKQAGKNRVVTG